MTLNRSEEFDGASRGCARRDRPLDRQKIRQCEEADTGRTSPRLPSPAIIVEWENALVCGVSRAERGMSELIRQIRQCAGAMDEPPELIIAFDPTRVAQEVVMGGLSACVGPSEWPMRVTLDRVSPAARYLDYKNECFGRTSRDIVMFLDSDVIPEPGWLRQMLLPFLNPRICVVTGNTYVDRHGLYARAFALFWFYPVRCREDGLLASNVIFPSNVAFRREIFARFPFPAGRYFRGKIYEHACALWRAGVPVLQQMAARGAHPPPAGLRYFVRRALCQGHDFALLESEPGYQPPLPTFIKNLRRATTRIATRREELDANWGTVAVSAALATMYYSLVLCGQLLGRSYPKLVRRYFPI